MADDSYPLTAVVTTGLILLANVLYCIVGSKRIRLLEARMRTLEEKQDTLSVSVTPPQQTTYTNPQYYPPVYTYAQQPQPTAPTYGYYQDPQRV